MLHFFAHGIFLLVYSFANLYMLARSWSFAEVFNGYYLILMTFLLFVDMTVRYGRILGEDAGPPGFLEWLFRRRSQ